MKKFLLLIAFFSIYIPSFSQEEEYDELLLNNPLIRIGAMDAVNLMYDFKFDEAENRFRYLKNEFPDHPISFFLMGLSNWWKIMPNIDDTQYDEVFMAYMDTAIQKSEQMGGKKAEYAEKTFFLAGSYAFIARLQSEREQWRKAAVTAKKALNYLEESRQYKEWSPEFLFGEGLYNYYSEWVKENYRFLRPILLFFPNGDMELGMKQLQDNAKDSYYTRTEGQYWLMRIYFYEDMDEQAIELSKYLHETFPDNAYFQRYYARLSFAQGKFSQCIKNSKEILEKIEKKYPGYEGVSGRYASFFLGYINRQGKVNRIKAKEYFNQCIQFSEQTGDTDAGYYLYSISNLAEMAAEEGKKDEAISRYKQLLELTEKGDKLNKEAIAYLKSEGEYDGGWWPF